MLFTILQDGANDLEKLVRNCWIAGPCLVPEIMLIVHLHVSTITVLERNYRMKTELQYMRSNMWTSRVERIISLWMAPQSPRYASRSLPVHVYRLHCCTKKLLSAFVRSAWKRLYIVSTTHWSHFCRERCWRNKATNNLQKNSEWAFQTKRPWISP